MNGCEQIQTGLGDGILTLRINRPDKKNALNLSMYNDLAAGLARADRDDAVRVVLITGGDHCFTSGNDLEDFLGAPPTGMDSPVIRFLLALCEARKPIVAAVNGVAIGIGVTMLLHCDLAYAGMGATMQMPFVNLGLCPEAASTLLLPRLMGHQRAAELLLLGEPFSADKALSLGIVTAVCADAEVQSLVLSKARQLADQPAAAVRLTKALLKRDVAAELKETILEEARQFMDRLKSPEAGEALQAFMQRRKPDFSQFS